MSERAPETPANALNKHVGVETGEVDELQRLRSSRDAAVRAAQAAVYNTTRLTRLLTILSEPASLDVLLDRVLSTLSELFSSDIVALVDPAGTGSFTPRAAIGLPEEMIGQSLSGATGGFTEAVLLTQTPVLCADASDNPKVDAQLCELGVQTAIWLPVIGNYAVRGVLLLARCQPQPFLHSDVDLLTAMAYRIGLALEQAQRSAQLEQIVQASREIARVLDEPAVCQEAVLRFPAVLGADSASIILFDAHRKARCVAQVGLDPLRCGPWCRYAESLLEDKNFVMTVPVSTPDLQDGKTGFSKQALKECIVRAALVVPIHREERVEGLLFAMRFSPTPFSPDSLQMAMLYARQTSSALENARLYRAARDELSERNRAEQALRASDERFRALIRSVSDVITILTAEGIVRYVSPAVDGGWGCPADRLLGRSMLERAHPDDRAVLVQLFESVLKNPRATLTGFARLRYGGDNWRDFEVIVTNLLDEPAIGGIVATYHDITERNVYEQQLSHLAYCDTLTGLANRTYFVEQLRQAIAHADASDRAVAVLFFDLDNFKIINDSLGHDWGDEVLRVVANRIRTCMRREDTPARFGGDEFTVLVEGITSRDQVIPIANRLIGALQDPIRLKGHDLFISCSMGIAFSKLREDNTEDLLRKADLAMYQAKSNGKCCYAIFDVQMNTMAIKRLEMETELRVALRRKELRVYYQPILSLETGQVVEVEALIRWQHPQHGIVSPAELIPLAEETGLIIELGQWVLEEACRQVRIWQMQYPSSQPLWLSANLSARQFRHGALVDDISAVLQESGLDPHNLMLEITESSLIQDPVMMISKLNELKNIGVRLAVDDFGAGYTSLGYLRQFPVDTLKIDRSFVQGIIHNSSDRAIIRGLVDIAAAFGLTMIGEGIETEALAEQLLGLGCTFGQGYLFACPLPAAEFEQYLVRQRAEKAQLYRVDVLTGAQPGEAFV